MKRKWKVLTLVTVVVVGFAVAVALVSYLDYRSAIDCVLTWGRLAPFPSDVKDFDIDTGGTFFTRQFWVTFRAEPEVTRKWLSDSPGIANADREEISPTTAKYKIKPGGGANFASVEVDTESGVVKVYVAWS